jgi:hypothetical protein
MSAGAIIVIDGRVGAAYCEGGALDVIAVNRVRVGDALISLGFGKY